MFGKNNSSRLGEIKCNKQGCLMKIIEYSDSMNIMVEFQDEYKAKVRTQYGHFVSGEIKNPYYKSVFDVGMVGVKYPKSINSRITKEYNAWSGILRRCFNIEHKKMHPTYRDTTCCKEWLLYENFCEWLHSQENFEKWLNGDRWAIDKDILAKGNDIYSPKTCCLVPMNINSMFAYKKPKTYESELPIGVGRHKNKYVARCSNPITEKREQLGAYSTPEMAFQVYKKYKEDLIKQVAELEYAQGNITKKCYNAMINYQVEITD